MVCQECGKRPATVHVTKVVNGHKTEFHFCGSCAREKGEIGLTAEPPFSIHNLVGSLLGVEAFGPPAVAMVRCERCGTTYQEFSRSGLLGCAHCYEVFREPLQPVLRRVHGATAHTGKMPRRAAGTLGVRRRVEDLRRRLQEAVAREEFEAAARIRDEIRSLEESLRRKEARP
ncbi:MAG: UvrB/UvrC motif-containing protein [Clostridia bacterium]|nr:UvrB/UvrC motif-containing protein [Clostridia bacterium]